MNRIALTFAALAFAGSAQALEVTNLDKIDHRVLFETGGDAREYDVPVDRTVYIPGQPNGRLSLITAQKPKVAKDTVQSDGFLSKYIGNGRTSGIPAETNDAFVIWENGEMGIQQRRRGGRFGN